MEGGNPRDRGVAVSILIGAAAVHHAISQLSGAVMSYHTTADKLASSVK